MPMGTLIIADNFTRPADTTAYASGDLVANSTTAGSVVPLAYDMSSYQTAPGLAGMIRRCRFRKTGTGVTNAAFYVHLYSTTSPTPANGDNGAWSTSGTASYIGYLTVTAMTAFTDGAVGIGTPGSGYEINFNLTGTKIYALIEARGAYTPSSAEVFTVSLEVVAG